MTRNQTNLVLAIAIFAILTALSYCLQSGSTKSDSAYLESDPVASLFWEAECENREKYFGTPGILHYGDQEYVLRGSGFVPISQDQSDIIRCGSPRP